MKYLYLLIILSAVLTSCSSTVAPVPIDFFKNDTIPLATKLKKVLEKDYLKGLGYNNEQAEWLNDYYSQRNFKPNWINDSMLTENGIALKKSLDRSMWFGIPEKRLNKHVSKLNLWVEEEIILTANAAMVLHDLNWGFLNFETKKMKKEWFVSTSAFDSAFVAKKNDQYDQVFLNQGPSDTNYRFISNYLYEYCSTYTLDTNTFNVEPFKTDTLHAFANAKEALNSKGYIKTVKIDTLEFDEALKLFQVHNGLKPDGKIGKYTCIALNESTSNKVLRAALAMDKLRLRKEYPDKCVRINIPEYLLRLYVNDSLKEIHNVVVGKVENQTPELESKIQRIVVYPYWKVPFSICSKEILPAAKSNSNYFARNNFKIYRNKVEVNPHSVNWKRIKENSFPYEVIQQPGPKNSLGIIKFEFNNSFSVYVHDSPQKALFKTDVRSYSHGCMRCENPVDLGKTILDYDSVGRKRNDLTRDSLDTLLLRAENFSIPLKKAIPIYVEYTTVYADKKHLTFFLDIYKRDEEYLKIMRD